jgi:hypothetical protein
MMARHRMLLASFFVQPVCPCRATRPEILDLHFQGRADAREAVGKGGDQGAVTQIAQGRGRPPLPVIRPAKGFGGAPSRKPRDASF